VSNELPRGYWNPVTETLPRDELRRLQWTKLQRQLEHVYARSPFYRQRLDEAGCAPDRIRSLDEYFERVPILRRDDIAAAESASPPPYGTLPAVDPATAIVHHQTSGSTGAPPVRTFDTTRDWTWIADMFSTGFYGLGLRASDKVAVAFGYGLFIGFWGGHYGLQRIGCQTFATGSLDSEMRISLIVENDITAVLCTPTYAMRLALAAERMGVDLAAESKVRLVVTSGEPRPDPTRQAIAEAFGAYVGDVAGMTEAGTLIMFECVEDPGGMHVIETDFIEEVLHPETLQPVDYGEQGVRVMTTLGREGIVMLRYWTNDLVVRRPHDECRCGRTWDFYAGGILGRVDDMRKIRGVWFVPVMVEDVVRRFPEIEEFQTTLETIDALDTLVVTIEPRQELSEADATALCERFATETKRTIQLMPKVKLAEPGSLPRFEMKAKRFRDARSETAAGVQR
jgi:phenylacetate-coenzyme A ligase PaaK-like adenylate-forming protein